MGPHVPRYDMDNNQGNDHFYPMKKHARIINQVLGLWAWAMVFASIAGSLFLLLGFRWARKVLPAFRKVMAGKPKSYLHISAKGLEYRNWPWGEIRCTWEDIGRINRGRWFGDALCLQRAEGIGFFEFSTSLGQQQIHLSSLVGWPGELETELRRYVPQAFGE